MESFIAAAGHPECVQLRQLRPLSTLLVWTRNTLYRLVVVDDSSVWVQGRALFADPTLAELVGASMGRGLLVDGCICIGLKIELRVAGTRVMTSPVLAMIPEATPNALVH